MRISDWSSDVCSSDLLLRSLGKADAMAPILDAADALARQLGRAMERAEAAILKHGEHQPKALDRVLDALGIDAADRRTLLRRMCSPVDGTDDIGALGPVSERSEEHTSELQSLMRISYAVFCLKKKKTTHNHNTTYHNSAH